LEKINYDRKFSDIVRGLKDGEKPSLLLQCCCGPCSSAVLERLCSNFKVTVFFYNPNIYPETEYNKRLEHMMLLLKSIGRENEVTFLECKYDPESFYDAVKGHESDREGGARCALCFSLRLDETAKTAKKLGFDYFCSTLTVSPHKNADVINKIGFALGEKHGIKFLPSDFKKKDGYKRSIELSKNFGLYRQEYCGCQFSLESAAENIK